MTRTASRNLLVAIAATALLAGCGSVDAGAAAVVGDRRISVTEVQTATADAHALGAQIDQSQILYMLAISPFVQEIAARYNATASPDEARKELGNKVKNPSKGLLSVIRAEISAGRIQNQAGPQMMQQAVAEANQKLDTAGFTVNPRFGEFDPKTRKFSPTKVNWLVDTKADLAPAPAPGQ
ncbi:MAG: hypothetical protein QG622_539 [Actinomycetota bacterium]|nr:hypothetical protein [Actinomycetota bacterium]